MRREDPRTRQPKTTPVSEEFAALRCCCGSLLARIIPDGVELKCRRCKRQVVIDLNHKVPVKITI